MKGLSLLSITTMLLTSCGLIDHLSERCGNGSGCEFLFGDDNERIKELEESDKRKDKKDKQQDKRLAALEKRMNLAEGMIIALNSNLNSLSDFTIDAINGLAAQISTINLVIVGIQSDINNLQNKDNDLQSQINALSSQLITTTVTFTDLINGLIVDIGDLQAEDVNLQSQITSAVNTLTSLNNTVNGLLVSIAELNLMDASLQSQIDGLQLQLTSSVSNLNTIISNLILNVNSVDVNLQSQINGLILSLTNLTNSLSNEERIVKIFDPCGDNVGQFDEIILQTQSGKFFAYFESGPQRFLSIIGNGNYQTTDSQHCNFSISGITISPAVQL